MILLALVLATVAVFATVGLREHRDLVRSRQAMLDGCLPQFDEAQVEIRPDGHPRISGVSDGRELRVSLLTDTFAPKRLPQLWLVLGMPAFVGMPRLAVTMRPRSEDIVSFGPTMNVFVPTPDWLPIDCVVRVDEPRAARILVACRESLASAFVDPRLKEIAFGPNGLRLVYQADEGRRGAHLLLRQARFDRPVEADLLSRLRARLLRIEHEVAADMTRWAA